MTRPPHPFWLLVLVPQTQDQEPERRRGRRFRGDAGQIGGVEAVPFGLLVLLVGILLIAHTWAVVDAKFRTTTEAREATRAFVEAPGPAAAGVVDGRVVGRFDRCAVVRFEARATVPAFGLPWRSDRPEITVRSTHDEVVDPYRDGLGGTADCRGAR
jgi:hypothetical protein